MNEWNLNHGKMPEQYNLTCFHHKEVLIVYTKLCVHMYFKTHGRTSCLDLKLEEIRETFLQML